MAKRKTKQVKKILREPKNAGGRPTDYLPEYAEEARKLCLLGAIDKELADFFGIAESTLNLWKLQHAEFSESIKAGKATADAQVADKLFNRAMGYEHQAIKIFADAKTGSELTVPYTERYPPDTVAAIFWLKNRRPDLWRDKNDHEVSGPKGGPIKSESTVTLKPDQAYLAMIGKK